MRVSGDEVRHSGFEQALGGLVRLSAEALSQAAGVELRKRAALNERGQNFRTLLDAFVAFRVRDDGREARIENLKDRLLDVVRHRLKRKFEQHIRSAVEFNARVRIRGFIEDFVTV